MTTSLGVQHQVIVDERPAEAVTDSALRWLDQDTERSFFAWVHYYDPHLPYRAPSPHREQFHDAPYLAEIAYADAQMGRLLERLDRRGVLDRTLVVVASDHGEGLGDHGEGTHGYFLYQSTMHVPLVFRSPGLATGHVVEHAIGLVDVAPTILDFLGLADEHCTGISRLPELHGEVGTTHPVFMESELPRLVYGFQPISAVTDGRHKFIEGGERELYDLGRDPDELSNRVDAEAHRVEPMRRRLQAYRDTPEVLAQHEPDNEALQMLKALGYAVGRNTEVTRAEWTRDELLRVVSLRNQAVDLLRVGDSEGCLTAAGELLALSPDCAQGHSAKGAALGMQGNYAEAIPALERSLELDSHQARDPLEPGAVLLPDRPGATRPGRSRGDAESRPRNTCRRTVGWLNARCCRRTRPPHALTWTRW